jgi:lincosamide nucleotidyltransferase A/C/D/E
MTDTSETGQEEHDGMLTVATRALYRFFKSHRTFDVVAVWISRRVRELPPSSPLNGVLAPLRARFRGEMKVADVLKVVDALEEHGVHFWIAGGWGVDLLVGAPTRRHDDLDVVLADYEGEQAQACDALAPLGYRQTEVLDGLWMTPRNLLEDAAGHQIEILGLDRPRVDVALGFSHDGPEPPKIEDRAPELFAVGTMQDRPVPCLSAKLQLLFHSGFDPRAVDGPDTELLRSRAGPDELDRL